MRATKVPPRDTVLANTASAKAGEQLFLLLGCSHCHTPTIVTAPPGTLINGGAFVLPFTWSGLPHGHPHHDPVWAAAEELDVPVAIHTGIDPPARDLHRRYVRFLREHEAPARNYWGRRLWFGWTARAAAA